MTESACFFIEIAPNLTITLRWLERGLEASRVWLDWGLYRLFLVYDGVYRIDL